MSNHRNFTRGFALLLVLLLAFGLCACTDNREESENPAPTGQNSVTEEREPSGSDHSGEDTPGEDTPDTPPPEHTTGGTPPNDTPIELPVVP